jgi:hypothetical protein
MANERNENPPSNQGLQDRSRINIHDPEELRYWANEFQCSEDDIKEAVQNIPTVSARRVKEYLMDKGKGGSSR